MEIKAVPTGVTLDLRPLRLGDVKTVARMKRRPYDGDMLCVLDLALGDPAVVDEGPYTGLAEGPKPDLQRILTWDLLSILLQLRGAKDPTVRLTPTCGFGATCGAMRDDGDPIILDLTDISHFEASEEGLASIAEDRDAIVEIDGHKVYLRPPLNDKAGLDALAEMSGVDAMDYAYRSAIRKVIEPKGSEVHPLDWWDNLDDWALADKIKEAVDDLWGGIDMLYRWRCGECGKEQPDFIPFNMLYVPQMDQLPGSTLPRRKKGILPLKRAKKTT